MDKTDVKDGFTGRKSKMRALAGWTPFMKISEATGLPYISVTNWFNGRYKMPADAAIKIAKCLNIPIDVLVSANLEDYRIERGFEAPVEEDVIQVPHVSRNIHPGNTADAYKALNPDMEILDNTSSIVPLLEKALEFARTHNL